MELGKRIGARLELARTWMEVGKRLLKQGPVASEMDGVSAEEYLSRAKAFFKEKELDWDLAQLQIIAKDR
jgi:hypothetical protein